MMKLLSKVKFDGFGIRFSLEDLDWRTIVGLVVVLGFIVYLVK